MVKYKTKNWCNMLHRLFQPNIKKLESRSDIIGLIKCFRKKDPTRIQDIPGNAAKALGRINNKEALPLLFSMLNDPDPIIRECVVITLTEMKRPECVPKLINALADETSFVREKAAAGLAELADTSAVEPLIHCLFNKNEPITSNIKRYAANALANIGNKTAIMAMAHIITQRPSTFSPRDEIKRAFRKIKNPASFEILVKFLENSSRVLACCASAALGNIGDERVVEPLICFLEKTDNMKVHCSVYEGEGFAALSKTGSFVAAEYLLRKVFEGYEVIQRYNIIKIKKGSRIYFELEGYGRFPSIYPMVARSAIEMKQKMDSTETPVDLSQKFELLEIYFSEIKRVYHLTEYYYCGGCKTWCNWDAEHHCAHRAF